MSQKTSDEELCATHALSALDGHFESFIVLEGPSAPAQIFYSKSRVGWWGGWGDLSLVISLDLGINTSNKQNCLEKSRR